MPRIHCFTSISFSYLDKARVLAETVRAHHPNWTLWLLLSDIEPPGFIFDSAREPFDHVVRSSDLDIPEFERWIFGHDVVEACTAVKGAMMHKLVGEDADAVVYLDPDIAVFAPLDDVEEMVSIHSVVLTPHVVQPERQIEGVLDNEIGSLKHGVYNLGFVAVQSSDVGRQFASWWRDRLLKFCHDDVPNGLFTDQRWCDLVPALFADVGILRNPGYNVASWNLGNRPISIGFDGVIRAAGTPLKFFHFTKVNTVGEAMLERYAYGDTEVFELLRWYRARLASHQVVGLPERWWAYGTYADGTAVPRSHRLAWRSRQDLQLHFADPFAAGPGTFKEWCSVTGLN